MRRAAAVIGGALLAGCTTAARVKVLPIINPDTYDVACCVAYVDIPPSTQASMTLTHDGGAGTQIKLGARWRF